MRLIRSLRYHLSHDGVVGVLRKGASWLRRLAYRNEEWLLLEADLPLPSAGSSAPGVMVQAMTMDDLVRLNHFKALHYPEDLQARFPLGDLCLGFLIDGKLAHAAWMSRGRLPVDVGIPELPAPDAVGIYDMFTHPDFRRRGLQTQAITELARRGAGEGYARALATVHEGNTPSLAAFRRCGFRIAGRLRYRRIFGRGRLHRLEPGE